MKRHHIKMMLEMLTLVEASVSAQADARCQKLDADLAALALLKQWNESMDGIK